MELVDKARLMRQLDQCWRASGLQQREMLASVGLSNGAWTKWMNQGNMPRFESLERVVAACGGHLSIEITPPGQGHATMAIPFDRVGAARALLDLEDPSYAEVVLRALPSLLRRDRHTLDTLVQRALSDG